ncbi:MAG: hypothetical protein Q8R35_03195 [bacterium]|nr:hypothetical protein [bacterium]
MSSFGPYIGITDFTTRSETGAMLTCFERLAARRVPHKLMPGVMMSYKTLRGKETKWSRVFPRKEVVASIFVRHPLAFNTLHYADYDGADVFNSLVEAIFWGGIDIDALQLDMIWPDPGIIANAVHASRKAISVILQVGKNALEEARNEPEEVLRRIQDYLGAIDGVLFDKSMGRGRLMDAGALLGYVQLVRNSTNLRVAVAGGLGPATMSAVEPIIKEFPDTSIDAQGKLRPSGSALDPIDWSMAAEYLQIAVSLFEKHQPSVPRPA